MRLSRNATIILSDISSQNATDLEVSGCVRADKPRLDTIGAGGCQEQCWCPKVKPLYCKLIICYIRLLAQSAWSHPRSVIGARNHAAD